MSSLVQQYQALIAEAKAFEGEASLAWQEDFERACDAGLVDRWSRDDFESSRASLLTANANILHKRADDILAGALTEPKFSDVGIIPPAPTNMASLVGDFSNIRALRTDAEMAAVHATYQRRSEETVESVAARIAAAGGDCDHYRA